VRWANNSWLYISDREQQQQTKTNKNKQNTLSNRSKIAGQQLAEKQEANKEGADARARECMCDVYPTF
jgi:hypothetical protein